jgi:hypothetical protein
LLTTLYLYKQFAEIADATSDKKLTRCIAASSAAIESWLNRTVGDTTHKIWLDGNGDAHDHQIPGAERALQLASGFIGVRHGLLD